VLNVGDLFECWTVTGHVKGARYAVSCVCGNTNVVYESSLTGRKTVSCGCMRASRRPKVGQRIAEWEILEWSGPPNRLATCRCSCGAVKEIEVYSLGRTSLSCGHERHPNNAPHPEGTKLCARCKESLPLEAFHADNASSDARRPRCKACVKAYDDERQPVRNRRARQTYAANPQAKIEQTRAYHQSRPEWSRERLRASHLRHAALRRERAAARGLDPEVAQRRRDATRRAESRRRALKRGAPADQITARQLAELITAYGNCCYICRASFSDPNIKIHIDHFWPLARGGSHMLSNLRPACSDCNTRKSARWPFTAEMMVEVAELVIAERRMRVDVSISVWSVDSDVSRAQ
jgi:5-methylcytosine-specific restriction endonuclease McrA